MFCLNDLSISKIVSHFEDKDKFFAIVTTAQFEAEHLTSFSTTSQANSTIE